MPIRFVSAEEDGKIAVVYGVRTQGDAPRFMLISVTD